MQLRSPLCGLPCRKPRKHVFFPLSIEESEGEKPKKKSPAAKKSKKKEDESDGEEEEEEKEDKRNKIKKVKQLDSKHRPPCMFGKKCYRSDTYLNKHHCKPLYFSVYFSPFYPH